MHPNLYRILIDKVWQTFILVVSVVILLTIPLVSFCPNHENVGLLNKADLVTISNLITSPSAKPQTKVIYLCVNDVTNKL